MTLSTVGVVGDGALSEEIREMAESEDVTVVHESADEVLDADPEILDADPETVVAVGESALLALVRAGVSVPVLPVGAGPGYGGVPVEETTADTETENVTAESNAADLTDESKAEETTDESKAEETTAKSDATDTTVKSDAIDATTAMAAVESLLAGAYETESRALLGVTVGEEDVGPALSDVMLVTTEPARISEYAIRSRDEEVEQFRADGVVVSTPTGSHGYGRNAGGPLLEPASGVVGVVPVAPFAVDVDHWVLSADRPVTLTVERDEGEVSLLVDDRTVRPVPPHAPVEVVEDGSLTLARVAESRAFFEQ